MTEQQRGEFLPDDARKVMVQFIANYIAPRAAYRVSNALSKCSDSDLTKVMAVSNFYSANRLDPTSIGGLVSGDDVESVRLMAEHLDTLDNLGISMEKFNTLLRSLERLGILPIGADSFPALKQHLEVADLSYLGKTDYYHNDALMVFVQENLGRHDEVIQFMFDKKTQDVGLLRAHFYGEASALSQGNL